MVNSKPLNPRGFYDYHYKIGQLIMSQQRKPRITVRLDNDGSMLLTESKEMLAFVPNILLRKLDSLYDLANMLMGVDDSYARSILKAIRL